MGDPVAERYYLASLVQDCFGVATDCKKPATTELRNGRNEVIGRYCTQHGQQRLAILMRDLKR